MGGDIDFPQLKLRYSQMDVDRMLRDQRDALQVVRVVRCVGDFTEVLPIRRVQQTPQGLWVEVG